jgi:hypothetical protein
VGPRASLQDVMMRKFLRLLGLEVRSLGRPACSELVYRLPFVSSYSYIVSMDIPQNMKSGLIIEHERPPNFVEHERDSSKLMCGVLLPEIARLSSIYLRNTL